MDVQLLQVDQAGEVLQAASVTFVWTISSRLRLVSLPIASSPASLAGDECRLIDSICFIPCRWLKPRPGDLRRADHHPPHLGQPARCSKPRSSTAVRQTFSDFEVLQVLADERARRW